MTATTITLGDEITYRVAKDFYGALHAKSTVSLPQLPGEHRLRLHTFKHKQRGIVCMASVHKIEDGFEVHRMFSDYSQCVHEDRTVLRATEKAIRAAHEKAIADLDKIIASVVTHYAPYAHMEATDAYNAAYADSLAIPG